MKISLIGYMGAGKTTLGKALSLQLGLPFYDLDDVIAAKNDQSVSELILNKGELFFRQQERLALEEVLLKPSFVLGLGGGTPCYYDNIDLINRSSLSIYLESSLKQLLDVLVADRQERPLIAHLNDVDLKEFIAKHLFERREFYERAIFKLSHKQNDLQERIQLIKEYTL
jgi:shikimate kinase